MDSARRIVLTRVGGLRAFRAVLTDWLAVMSPVDAQRTSVVVPTRAAAEQLRRTVEDHVLVRPGTAVCWPHLVTRADLYDALASRLLSPPRVASPVEREVLLFSAARAVIARGVAPPYDVRPGLIAEMLALYDHVRRLGRSVDDFERNLRLDLERDSDTDRGALTLLEQTMFLSALYREYEQRLSTSGARDEHTLREALVAGPLTRPMTRLIVTVGDRVGDPEGLWPADYDLLARLPHLEEVQLLATEAQLSAGHLDRLHGAFPDLEDRHAGPAFSHPPALIVPPASSGPRVLYTVHRDREEELTAVARRLKQQHRQDEGEMLHRQALVVRRPLPYLYVAREVFADTGIAFESLDTLPLAAEPYAALIDLVLEVVAADASRRALMALARSPHVHFAPSLAVDEPASATDWDLALAACDAALAEARYRGGVTRLTALIDDWSRLDAASSREARRRQRALPALRALTDAVTPLMPLADEAAMVQHLERLVNWLARFGRVVPIDDAVGEREARVRAAVLDVLHGLAEAYARHDPEATGTVQTLRAAIRRWLGARTFALRTGSPGVQIVDAQAARYGAFDDIQLVGLVDGEWPDRPRRNVLYPSTLLASLEPMPALGDPSMRERETLQSARAAFKDLLSSPTRAVRLSTFALENDAVVEPSLLLDSVDTLGLTLVEESVSGHRIAISEALALSPMRIDVVPTEVRPWSEVRFAPDTRPPAHRRGQAGPWTMPRVSVSRLELYLGCPFRFFARHVLHLDEEPEDQDLQTPLERGRFLHEMWERFFSEWRRLGHGRIGRRELPAARALFQDVCEQALTALSPVEAALERHRLVGSAVGPGIAHRVFAMEAGRSAAVVDRLIEFALEGDFPMRSTDGSTRLIHINAKTDRIDVLDGGALRVIDYKSKNTPDPKVALQLPIYAHLARTRLEQETGRRLLLDEAMYVSFEGPRPVVPLRPAAGQTLEDVVADAEARLIEALDRIAAGHFPPQPAKKSMCGPCAYRTVCRLEWQAPESHEGEHA